jgi:hypothetical protein
VPELEHLGLRELLFDGYRIIYRFVAPRVDILGVIHGARVLDERFFAEM